LIPKAFEPSPPVFQSVFLRDGVLRVLWQPSQDMDGDLLGYRVYVSTRSRGWNFEDFSGTVECEQFFRPGWRACDYPALFMEPPDDLLRLETSETEFSTPVPLGQTVYVSVMPVDRHGRDVGRVLFRLSEELAIPVP
jgi:hypothetical protein